MPNPWVHDRMTGRDTDGRPVRVGVDYSLVTIGDYRLDRGQAAEFARAFTEACWEAADNARLMAEDTAT